MMEKQENGKTLGDVVHLLLARIDLFGVFLIALAVVLGVVAFVHLNAEPGTQVSIFGVSYIKSTKKLSSEEKQKEAAISDGYQLPWNRAIPMDKSLPILDGTIALKRNNEMGYEANLGTKSIPGSSGRMLGINLEKLHINARNLDGTKGVIERIENEDALVFSGNSRLELEYRGKYFAVTISGGNRDEEMIAKVERLQTPTVDLIPIEKLAIYSTGGD